MDTLHPNFLQPTPLFPLRNKTKVKLLYKNLSSLRTSLEQDFGFRVGEHDEAMKGLEAQLRDVSVELRFQIEEELRLFYLGKSMKLRLHSAQKLLPILSGAIKGGIQTIDFNSVMEMLGKHFTLPTGKENREEEVYVVVQSRKCNQTRRISLTSYIKKDMLKVKNAYHQSNNSQNNNPAASLRGLELDNIPTLQVDDYSSCEPLDIWGLPQLKNISVRSITLVPPRSVHHNLESIRSLDYRSCTKELFLRIPNLRTLEVTTNLEIKCKAPNWFESLVYLYKLEVLMVDAKLGEFSTIYSMEMLNLENFWPNLKELNLANTNLKWKDMDVVGKLSKLEDLRLMSYVVKDRKWKPKDGGFRRLRFLKIRCCPLQYWEATSNHFPVLEILELWHIKLKEIPSGFAEITTLKSIKLYDCLESLISSAERIQEEQQEYGNDTFVVDITR
nr:putative disease resistance RPP13-like protein 3 [Ipomoea batatas]